MPSDWTYTLLDGHTGEGFLFQVPEQPDHAVEQPPLSWIAHACNSLFTFHPRPATNIPQSVNAFRGGQGDYAMVNEPFCRSGTACWNLGYDGRYEVDDIRPTNDAVCK